MELAGSLGAGAGFLVFSEVLDQVRRCDPDFGVWILQRSSERRQTRVGAHDRCTERNEAEYVLTERLIGPGQGCDERLKSFRTHIAKDASCPYACLRVVPVLDHDC